MATGIMEACRHFSSLPKAHKEFTNGVVSLKDALPGMANDKGVNFNEKKFTISGLFLWKGTFCMAIMQSGVLAQ